MVVCPQQAFMQAKMRAGANAGPVAGGWEGPQWPPAGSLGSGSFMGISPMARMLGTSPMFGKSVDMVDVCTQLMENGGELRQDAMNASYYVSECLVFLAESQ